MISRLGYSTLQRGLMLFWAVWLSLITLTNFFDALRQLGVLPDDFTLASYNFDLVRQTLGTQGVPTFVAVVLFGVVILWEALASGLFFRGWMSLRKGAPDTDAAVTRAFVVSLALWASFLVATEALVSYETAGTHKATLVAQLVSLLVIRGGFQGHGHGTTPD